MPDTAPGDAARPRKERTENAARRRGQLIDATLRSIVRNGLQGTTLATVSREAGLSQGVAVFYFQSKDALLAAALQRHYELYEANWTAARAAAGPAPADRLAAMIRADFEPSVCSREAQVVWHAFWGEASAQPLYAQIADRFDRARSGAIVAEVAGVLEGTGQGGRAAEEIGAGLEALTDGLWLQIYLSGGEVGVADSLRVARRYLTALFPAHSAAFEAVA